MSKEEIGLRIKRVRINMGLTKEKFANILGLSGQYLGMVERGRGSLTYDKLEKLCKLSGLSADYILFGIDSSLTSDIKDELSQYTDEQITAGCDCLKDLAILLKHLA